MGVRQSAVFVLAACHDSLFPLGKLRSKKEVLLGQRRAQQTSAQIRLSNQAERCSTSIRLECVVFQHMRQTGLRLKSRTGFDTNCDCGTTVSPSLARGRGRVSA